MIPVHMRECRWDDIQIGSSDGAEIETGRISDCSSETIVAEKKTILLHVQKIFHMQRVGYVLQ